MVTAREGFNLFTRRGRANFFRKGWFGDRWSRKYVLKDTFGRYICSFLGHSKSTFLTDDNPAWVVCLRCFGRITLEKGANHASEGSNF